MYTSTEDQKKKASQWFEELRASICKTFETIEEEYTQSDRPAGKFEFRSWERPGGGGGISAVLKNGRVFEKVGVNVSTVFGEFTPDFARQIPGAQKDATFWASGISLVSHMQNPHVPAAHMNTRHICTQQSWWGGGSDLTPMFPNEEDTQTFHQILKEACDKHDPEYYPKFKKWCDNYFYLPHRQEPRGVGGIFYDDLNSGDWEKDFAFTQDVGKSFEDAYARIIRRRMNQPWTEEDRAHQLHRRGRYVEFNLLYDRGTLFGLQTGGDVEAILMSLPPAVSW